MRTEPAVDEAIFHDALAQLQGNTDALPWTRRRELCLAIAESIAGHGAKTIAMRLLDRLATDAKWEVRKAVADVLLLLPASAFEQLAAKLGKDSNAYVRRAVERASRRRQAEERANRRHQRSTDQVKELLDSIESKHGKAAAAKALKLCERYAELLVGSMVHDLRSIVTYLKTNCYALIDQSTSEDRTKAKRLSARVRADVEFLEVAIEDMTTFTQPLSAERQPERLTEVVAEALNLARENVRRSQSNPDAVSVHMDIPESIVVAMARHQIVMALANVLKNAIEACVSQRDEVRQARISIDATRSREQVIIRVHDNGVGISSEEAQGLMLFTPGRRNKTKRHSSGYGLPIAARNLASHGGTLTLESREDQGTEVTMTLPSSHWEANR